MLKFHPSFSFWPSPRFLGDSSDGLAAWLSRRVATTGTPIGNSSAASIRRIIEEHHDRHDRIIFPARRADV